jgi:D-sedoheptulose 7-phosphate isomerase
MKSITDCQSYFRSLSATIDKLPIAVIEDITEILISAYEKQRTIFLFGNGGSAALASHFACDLAKGTISNNGKRFRTMALTDNVPLITAWANDAKYEDIFAEQLANFAESNDVAFAISGSGNSPNIIKALNKARHAGLVTVGITGFEGGKMKDLCDACVIIPSDNMQLIEDLHLCVSHALFTCVRLKLASTQPHQFWKTSPALASPRI